MLAEDRLDRVVESHRLGPGEEVIVLTKMGEEVARGKVVDVYPDGSVHFRESASKNVTAAERIYDPSLYEFVPLEAEEGEQSIEPDTSLLPDLDTEPQSPTIAEQPANDSPDDRAAAKMKSGGIDVTKKGGGGGRNTPMSDGGGKSPPKKKKDGNGNSDDKSGVQKDNREPESKVNVDALPEQLRKQVIGIKGLDEAQRNRVIAEISSAALRAMKDVGVKETEVYATIVDIQKAVEGVLTS